MFGSEYSNHPEILLSSFKQMHEDYKKAAKHRKSKINLLQSIYLRIFGIPEIGFQLRSLYFEKIMKERIKEKSINKILDAGSGIGTYSIWLARSFPRAQVFGGDVDREKIAFTKKFSKELGFKNVSFGFLDVTKKPKRMIRYDLVVNIDVLEHISDYERAIKNLVFQLGSGGYLYIHTPQPNQKRLFKSFKNWEHEDHVHEGFTPADLVRLLKKLGLNIVDMRETFGFWGKLAWELNHMTLKKGFVISGILYPLFYILSLADLFFDNEKGLGIAILAKNSK